MLPSLRWPLLAAVLIVTGCAAERSTAETLYPVLLKETGYKLGADKAVRTAGDCAAESRYGGGTSGPVTVLVCVDRHVSGGGRIRYRIHFTAPEAGHRIWKMEASWPDTTMAETDLASELTEKFGPPERKDAPLSLIWQRGGAYLELAEDDYGLHLTLWDRNLRRTGS